MGAPALGCFASGSLLTACDADVGGTAVGCSHAVGAQPSNSGQRTAQQWSPTPLGSRVGRLPRQPRFESQWLAALEFVSFLHSKLTFRNGAAEQFLCCEAAAGISAVTDTRIPAQAV